MALFSVLCSNQLSYLDIVLYLFAYSKLAPKKQDRYGPCITMLQLYLTSKKFLSESVKEVCVPNTLLALYNLMFSKAALQDLCQPVV